jgi:phytoene dehydrogenase-like protein
VQFAPYHLRDSTSVGQRKTSVNNADRYHDTTGDSGEWDARREAFGSMVIETLERYAPGLRSLVVRGEVLTPVDLERGWGLTGGHIFHGELSLDQFFTMRPLLGFGSYRTPIRGLYLCGSGAHPGTGLTGGSGANAGRAIVNELT